MKGPIVDMERAYKAADALHQMFGKSLAEDQTACADVKALEDSGQALWELLNQGQRESLAHLALAFIQGVQSREIFIQIIDTDFKQARSLAEMEKILALHGAMSAVPMLACVLAFRLTEEKE